MRLLYFVIFLFANVFFASAQNKESREEIANAKIQSVLPNDVPISRNGYKTYLSLEKLFYSENADSILKRQIIDLALDSLYPEMRDYIPKLIFAKGNGISKIQKEKIWLIVKSEFMQNVKIKDRFVDYLLNPGTTEYVEKFRELRKSENLDNNKIREGNIEMIRKRLYKNGSDEELNDEIINAVKEAYQISGDTIPTSVAFISRDLIFEGNNKFYSFILPYILKNPNKIIKSYTGDSFDIYSSVPEFFFYLFELALDVKICPNLQRTSKNTNDGYFKDIDPQSKEDFWNWCRKYNKTLNQ